MKLSEINNSISTLPGVGPATAAVFSRLNIFTVGDLLQFYPRDWEDRTRRITLNQFELFPKVHTIARVTGHEWFGFGRMKTLKILITDGTAQAELVAFNRPFMEKSCPAGSIISVTGRFEVKYSKLQSTSFETEKIADSGTLEEYADTPVPGSRVYPVYPLTEGLTQKAVAKAMDAALKHYSLGIENELPDNIIESRNLMSKSQALRCIHQPETIQEALQARNTLAYEEFFHFHRIMAERSFFHRGKLPPADPSQIQSVQKQVSLEDFITTLSPRQKHLLSRLDFALTDDQRAVIAQLNDDIDRSYSPTRPLGDHQGRPFYMRSLLQGDVGSGKTLTAFFAALRVIDCGSQCAFMAPTEILARQHAENAAKLLSPLGVNVAFLAGNINTKGRNNLLSALRSGEVNLVIGTHALFSRNVIYNDLAFVVIDEQHRFGVMQRSAVIDKGRTSMHPLLSEPDLLMMSATPIPQTLAQTLYGDLDVLTIKTMPQGRQPVKTYLVKSGNERNAYEAVRKELKQGHQAYFVYPAIEQNLDGGDYSSGSALKSAEEMFDFLSKQVYPDFPCALIHGKIEENEQNRILTEFKEDRIKVLVATTVVEVGVDVPNATCMVIEQADRFGLAALHQLRGRVGRGKDQSYCFLIYRNEITETGIARMKALHETTDGFKIAEEDLKLRGPGEITGTAQSGELTFKIADIIRDSALMTESRKDAIESLSQLQR